MSRQYWFPRMSSDDIISSLSQWGLSISKEQLTRPSPDFIWSLYTSILEQATSLSQSALQEPLREALQTLDDTSSDLHSNSLAHNFIVTHLIDFAEAAKVPAFSAKDVFLPEPDRTKVVLSAFINYIKFCEQNAPIITECQKASTSAIEERKKVMGELEEVKMQLASLKAQRLKDEPKCLAYREENEKIMKVLYGKQAIQIDLGHDIEALKIQKASILSSKDNINKDIALVSDSISKTRPRIVQSPERIKRAITNMGSAAMEDKRTVAMNEQKARDLTGKYNALLVIEKEVRGCCEQLQTIEKEIDQLNASQKSLSAYRDLFDERRFARTELLMMHDRLLKQLSNAEDKLERAQKHAEDKKAAGMRTIERLRQEYEDIALERQQNDQELKVINDKADEIVVMMQDHMKRSEVELSELLTSYWNLRHNTDVYMETLATKLGMHVASD